MIHREFERSFDGLGAAVGKVSLCRAVDRANFFELFAQVGHMAVEEVGTAEMDKFVDLLCDRRYDLGMAMAGRTYGDACITVQEDIAIRVLDPNAAAAFDHQLVIRPRVARCNVA